MATAALAAVPVIVVLGVIAMFLSPHAFAESESTTGSGLWIGAALGLAMFLAFVGLPQLLFGLALRSGKRGRLTATALTAPIVALFFGLLPLVAALRDGWTGVAPLAVATAAAVAVLDAFVFAAAIRGRGRVGQLRSKQP